MDLKKLLSTSEPMESREGKLTMVALLMMLYVIALFVSVAIHEIMGHGLFTVLMGGDFYAFYLSPGSGYASVSLPQDIGNSGKAVMYMSGILVQLIIGALALFILMPRIKNFIWGLFTLMFCICMLVHSSMYLFMGYYMDGGDTFHAVDILGVEPDAFIVAGIILTGMFVLLISLAALRFIGRFMDLEDDGARARTLAAFWLPLLLLNGIISFIMALWLPRAEMAYPLVNSAVILLFIGVALMLVPAFSESVKEREHRISMGTVFSVVVCFMLLIAGWAGIFGLSRETAHGVLLHEPPIQAEIFYFDQTVGNVELAVYPNGTARADIILRDIMDSPSPLDNKIYRTFDQRPDWERYIARSRYMLAGMFNLNNSVTENLTFSTGFETVSAYNYEDGYGRRCTTYINLSNAGTRQYHISPGEQTPQPGIGVEEPDVVLGFMDPWKGQRGFLDRVRVTWEEGLEVTEVVVWNDYDAPTVQSLEGIGERSISWINDSLAESAFAYRVSFIVQEN